MLPSLIKRDFPHRFGLMTGLYSMTHDAALRLTAVGFAGLLTGESVPTLWVMLVMVGPGASISLALLFMVLRSTSTAQTSQVSGMAQSVGYLLAAVGPVTIGALHDLTASSTIAMAVLSLALVRQAISAMTAGRNVTMGLPEIRRAGDLTGHRL